jgi:ribosomal protein S18 acetylase RimI-like enzyme
MLADIVDREPVFTGPRRFNPLRDIRPMSELIELSFAEALDQSSRQMLQEMRTLSWLLGPLLWLVIKTDSPIGGIFDGYVWMEEGDIVGNVSVHQRYKGRKGWFISNLAVHPDHRRKGIAHRLMMQALELARTKGAPRVSLEVRAGNVPAQKLYEKLQFRKVDSVSKMRLERVSSMEPVSSEEYGVRMVRPDEWRKVYRLARESFSPGARDIAPVKERDYRHNFVQRVMSSLGDPLRGRFVFRWAAARTEQFCGLVTLRTAGVLLPHSLTMMVHPDHRGGPEEALLTTALSKLRNYPTRPVLANIQPSYEQVLHTFRRYGFLEEETLDLLTLSLEQA